MATTATMMGAQFDALPYEEGRRWELIDGELIPVSSPTLDHQEIVFLILAALKRHLEGTMGIASHDVEFALSENTRVRPDVWVLLAENAARIDRGKVPIPGPPDIAVEVISASEYSAESIRKVDSYLRHGTREVWQVYPQAQLVLTFAQNRGSRKLHYADVLTSTLLPGFSMPVSSIFG